MNLDAYFELKKKPVEAFLQSIKDPGPGLNHLVEAMKYSLLAGGKRLRPVLALASYEACLEKGKYQEGVIVPFAAALEMIHTYSLIHDDLPAMDNDDLRRGKPTSHKVFGEAVAILAGDALLTEAFAVMARVNAPRCESVLLEVIRDIADASGAFGMAGGQWLDLQAEGKKISVEELEKLHRHKTGCLIEVSVTTGAKLAGAQGEVLSSMVDYGRAIGLAFQIADDILDVEGGAELMGKNIGGDARKHKSTYPGLLGLAESKTKAASLEQQAIHSLEGFGAKGEVLRQIAHYIISRRS